MQSNKPLLLLTLLCSACHSSPQSAPEPHPSTTTSAVAASPAVVTPTPSPARAATFSVETLPVSDAPLGAFPYLSLPDGYEGMGAPAKQDYGEAYFWTGTEFRNVRGKVYKLNVHALPGKTMSPLEMRLNFDAEIKQLGGTQVTSSTIPSAAIAGLPKEGQTSVYSGVTDVFSTPTTTWVVRRADRQIWVQLLASNPYASWTMVETKPFEATAQLLPADKLQQAINLTGKAVIHVNFATDKAEILPTSQSQIAEVLALLNKNPTWRLSINGYTDDTGSPAHNQSLSAMRAAGVRTALLAKGIAAGRLEAKGFGASQPVAPNTTEDGKAQNRRVELVRL